MRALWALAWAVAPSVAVAEPIDGLVSDFTIVMEGADQGVRVEESWQLKNTGATAVPASALALTLPPGAKNPSVPPEATGFRASLDGRRIESEIELAAGATRTLTFVYLHPAPSGVVDWRRVPGARVQKLRVIAEDLPDLRLQTGLKLTRRQRDLNGLKFSVWEGDGPAAGTEIDLVFTGWPTHTDWPMRLGVVAAFAVVLGLAWMATQGKTPGALGRGQRALGALAPAARRDRLLEAIRLLEEDVAANRIERAPYLRRHQGLVEDLAITLRALDLERGPETDARGPSKA